MVDFQRIKDQISATPRFQLGTGSFRDQGFGFKDLVRITPKSVGIPYLGENQDTLNWPKMSKRHRGMMGCFNADPLDHPGSRQGRIQQIEVQKEEKGKSQETSSTRMRKCPLLEKGPRNGLVVTRTYKKLHNDVRYVIGPILLHFRNVPLPRGLCPTGCRTYFNQLVGKTVRDFFGKKQAQDNWGSWNETEEIRK